MLMNQGKKTFLIVTADVPKRKAIEVKIKNLVAECVVYTASDFAEAKLKIKNVPPHVVLTEMDLQKGKSGQLIEGILSDQKLKSTAVIIMSPLPERAKFIDPIVTGQVQFLEDSKHKTDFAPTVTRALEFSSKLLPANFYLRYLQPGDLLLKEGEAGNQVFILKKGNLQAYFIKDGKKTILGDIIPGEFVGEMAFFNGEPRMATVEAITACELIEIPTGSFEKVLFARPSWSKTLMQTLSKRLKRNNSSASGK